MSFGLDMHVNIPLKMYNNAANGFSSNLNTHKSQNTWGVDIPPQGVTKLCKLPRCPLILNLPFPWTWHKCRYLSFRSTSSGVWFTGYFMICWI